METQELIITQGQDEVPYFVSEWLTEENVIILTNKTNELDKIKISTINKKLNFIIEDSQKNSDLNSTENQFRLHQLESILFSPDNEIYEPESETDLSFGLHKPSYNPTEIIIDIKHLNIFVIKDMINYEDLEMNPEFQRNFIWNRTRQSKLIESLILGLPLPSIYLTEHPDGKLSIVDGLQRIHTIYNFLENKFKLTNLEYLHQYNGLTYNELLSRLDKLYLRQFRKQQIICFILDRRSPTSIKFDLFKRLNTGGIRLNNAEIRNSFMKIFLQKYLNEVISLQEFGNLTGLNINKDLRMQSRDNILRIIYFYNLLNDKYNPETEIHEIKLDEYTGSIENELNELVEKINNNQVNLPKTEIFSHVFNFIYSHFNEYAFRKLSPKDIDQGLIKRKPQLNKSLFVTITTLSLLNYKKLKFVELGATTQKTIIDFAWEIHSNKDFFQAISTSTNDRKSLELAFNYTLNFLKSHQLIS